MIRKCIQTRQDVLIAGIFYFQFLVQKLSSCQETFPAFTVEADTPLDRLVEKMNGTQDNCVYIRGIILEDVKMPKSTQTRVGCRIQNYGEMFSWNQDTAVASAAGTTHRALEGVLNCAPHIALGNQVVAHQGLSGMMSGLEGEGGTRKIMLPRRGS